MSNVPKFYERVHKVEFELTDAQYKTMQRASALVRIECGQDPTDDECRIAIFARVAGST